MINKKEILKSLRDKKCTPAKSRKHYERQECIAFAQWLRLHKIRFLHVPNGEERPKKKIVTKSGKIIQICPSGNVLKAMGVQKGFPDFIIWVKNKYHGALVIEMKQKNDGIISMEQQDWIDGLIDGGYLALACNGWDDARRATLAYLKTSKIKLR